MNTLFDRFQSNASTGTRSTILYSLQWMTAILLAGLGGTALAKVPDWTVQIISGLLIVVVILYLFFYCYFAIKSPDQLRSEKFTIRKMEIERGLIGDNIVGLSQQDDRLLGHKSELASDQGAKK